MRPCQLESVVFLGGQPSVGSYRSSGLASVPMYNYYIMNASVHKQPTVNRRKISFMIL